MTNESKKRYPGIFKRCLAYLIDIIPISLIGVMIKRILIDPMVDSGDFTLDEEILLRQGGLILTILLYSSVLESSKMQATIGKSIMGIYVEDMQGNRINPIHGIFRVIFLLFCGPFTILSCFTENRRMLHDIFSGTVVVKK